MSKNSTIRGEFLENMTDVLKFDEKTLNDKLNITMVAVEKDDDYTAKEKLKIYDLLSQITNCDPKERTKYMKKLGRVL